MRWLQTEYLLKGVYLGLVLYAALQQAATEHGWEALRALTCWRWADCCSLSSWRGWPKCARAIAFAAGC